MSLACQSDPPLRAAAEAQHAATPINLGGAADGRLGPALIQSLPVLSSLTLAQASWLSHRVGIRRLRRGEVLVHQGEPDRAFHIVCQGAVHTLRQGRNGRSLLLDVLLPGDHLGERGLIDQLPRETTARCAQATTLLSVNEADFLRCLTESFAMRASLLRVMSQRLRARNQRITMLALNDVRHCVVRHLHDASIEVQGQRVVASRVTRQFVADRIGASREMVSRIFKQLAASGEIQQRQDGSLLLQGSAPA